MLDRPMVIIPGQALMWPPPSHSSKILTSHSRISSWFLLARENSWELVNTVLNPSYAGQVCYYIALLSTENYFKNHLTLTFIKKKMQLPSKNPERMKINEFSQIKYIEHIHPCSGADWTLMFWSITTVIMVWSILTNSTKNLCVLTVSRYCIF